MSTLTAALVGHLTARETPGAACPSHPRGDILTEAGAAERFARRHGDTLRFDHRRGRWLVWGGHHWTPDADAAVLRVALDFARDWQHDALELADSAERDATLKFALSLERRDKQSNMLALARAYHPIADAGDAWDANPWLLGVPNGVVDLQTGERRAGRREDQLTMAAGVPFDPDARCPRWERFIAEVFAGDAALIEYVWRAIGYGLTGLTGEQCLFLCYGRGANGKGTFTGALLHVLGDYGWNMPFATVELRDRAAIPNDLASLVGRRFVTASETNDGARLNEARVKALTGGDPITARFLHSEFFTFQPAAKFWLSVNHKPVVRDDSHGFWRRIRLIPFVRQFEVNATLADELKAEATGILAWAVRGCLEWQGRGLAAPAVVMAATRDYERESDLLADFLDQACEVDDAAIVRAKELYLAYSEWAATNGLSDRERLTATAFGRKLGDRFEKDSDAQGRFYRGLALRPRNPTEPSRPSTETV